MLDHMKAVIFDLDGTLVDSMWIWTKIDEEYLGKFHIVPPKDLSNAIEGKSFTETAEYFKKRFFIQDSIDSIKETWNEMAFDKYSNHVPLKAGVKEFLEECVKRKIKLGIASSNSSQLVRTVLKRHQILSNFESVITGCDVCAGKPAPDVYLKAARDLNVKPEECLVFEDITAGIMAGKNAGMKVCAVEDDYSKYQREEKRKLADYYIKDYQDFFMKSYEVLA
ncbi:MAG: HAD family phosphatase [bacterium]|nr:HAD family phosphatase [bacterium]